MQKSIKKIIASAVAALMVISAMPFTALAAVGDYEPDVQLQFTPIFTESGSYNDPAMTRKTYKSYDATGLLAGPLVYDEANGTLTATADNMQIYDERNDTEFALEDDYVYEEGNVFALTVRMDGISKASHATVNIRFSENIAPAGIWTKGSGTSLTCGFSTSVPSGAKAYVGFENPVSAWSASGLYESMNQSALGDPSIIKDDPFAAEDDGWSDQMISAAFLATNSCDDISSVSADNGFFNIEDNTVEEGYTYENKAIMATFLFMIVDEGPIQFTLQDPYSEYSDNFGGAYVTVDKAEGNSPVERTTYAINKYNLETQKNDGDVEHPGSRKMTFMGKNVNKDSEPEPTRYTITFKNKDGGDISVKDYDEGATVAIPDLPANTYDDNYHYSYAWDTEPSATATATATYQVVETAEKHVFTGVEDPEANCTEGGVMTYTCSCGKSYTEDTEAKGHTPGVAQIENDTPSTCKEAGGYDEVIYCTTCGDELSRYHHDYELADHTPGEATKENDVPSTCTVPGGYDMVVRCTVCGTQIGQPTHYDYELAKHTPGEAVKENEVAATKKDRGSYDMVVYCTECNTEISRETFYTDALGVTITLNASSIGSVEGLETGANKLAYGTEITLTATPVGGATFVGWEIGGNIVSTNATYTTKAVSDVTITPVFEDAAASTITVTFYDKYGNTVKQYRDMTVEDYQTAIAAEFDSIKAPTYPSYTFTGWDKDKEDILALNVSTTIWATYEQALTTAYTVTTTAELILPDGVKNGEIPYDTKVTVRDTAAAAWEVNGAKVAYGTEYSFYVGSDVTVTPVYGEVEQKATVTVIGANLVAGSDYKYNIVATRNVPEGYELVDYGFVYGKDLTDAELDLDNVGAVAASGAKIKAVHAGTRNTESNEFAFNYGITKKNAPITAKAFITVTKGGETEIIYSDMFIQNYTTA